MKQLFFILFIIPSFCFAQLGIKQNTPSASLHIGQDNNLIPIKTQGIDHKTFENSDSLLVIGDDGTVKKTPHDVSNVKNLKFILKEDIYFGKDQQNTIKLKLQNIEEPEAANSSGSLLLPDTGSYAIAFRFFGDIQGKPFDDGGAAYKDPSKNTNFGQVKLKVINADDNTLLDQIDMVWIMSNVAHKISYNVVSEVHGKKGTPIRFELIRESGFGNNDTSKDWSIYSHGFVGTVPTSIQTGLPTIVLWKIK